MAQRRAFLRRLGLERGGLWNSWDMHMMKLIQLKTWVDGPDAVHSGVFVRGLSFSRSSLFLSCAGCGKCIGWLCLWKVGGGLWVSWRGEEGEGGRKGGGNSRAFADGDGGGGLQRRGVLGGQWLQ